MMCCVSTGRARVMFQADAANLLSTLCILRRFPVDAGQSLGEKYKMPV